MEASGIVVLDVKQTLTVSYIFQCAVQPAFSNNNKYGDADGVQRLSIPVMATALTSLQGIPGLALVTFSCLT